jgi:hypothetical protein
MAAIVIVTHEYDVFAYRRFPSPVIGSPYLLFDVLRHMERFGHSWRVTKGPKPVPGDVALLHVDSTVVDPEYVSLQSHYAKTFNFGVTDISKRKVSRMVLSRGDPWDGRVIVKGDLNSQARMETTHNEMAQRAGRPLPHPGVTKTDSYRVLDCLADVEEEVWDDPSLVVERFIPEPDEDGGFVLRTWVFLGNRERCTRMVSTDPISKAAAVLRYEPAEVPEKLRVERERLNFDFGKFDFVMHEGEPVLFDANKTPGVATAILPLMKAGALNLAEGFDALVRGAG